MIGVVVDHNIELQGALLRDVFSPEQWRGMRVSGYRTLVECGFSTDASDREIWTYCQSQDSVLLTANRNKRGPDALQLVIEQLGTSISLPVLTLANANRVLIDREYRELCAYGIADVALSIDSLRGTGRLFLPMSVG